MPDRTIVMNIASTSHSSEILLIKHCPWFGNTVNRGFGFTLKISATKWKNISYEY